jgi:peptidyl-dipeptidase A
VVRYAPCAFLLILLGGCGVAPPKPGSQEFLRMYSDVFQRLTKIDSEANWKAATDVSEQHTGERIGADSAVAAFTGNRYVIENSRAFLASRAQLPELEFRQLDKVLLNAAESPDTIPEIVERRISSEAKLKAILDGFTFCLDKRGPKCSQPITANRIDEALAGSNDLALRRLMWETSKQTGPALRSGLLEVRDLRNRVAQELGYSSYFHLQVADYGMSVDELMKLMDRTVDDVQPLYEQLHLYARRKLAARFKQPVPQTIPAHWVGNRWAQAWPGLVETANLDELLKGKSPEWLVQQAERFYVSLGFPTLPKSFWAKSDLYEVPEGSPRKKNTHASAWHMDLDQDVRSLMSVVPNYYWFETTHHELGHIYYYLAYSTPKVPVVLRGGANRAFHEAIGDLIAIAARQEQYLKGIGLMPADRNIDQTQYLLAEAMDSAVVFVPFGAGTMTHYEHDLYEKKLPAEELNARWWKYAREFQGIVPPTPRGEEFCDACTKTHIIDDPAQYYDYAMAALIKYQLHDHIARKILKQDPRNCNYYGNKEVGAWLQSILSLGQTRDWRQVLKEKTGEDLSSRAMREYFAPVLEYLKKENAGAPSAW